MWGLKNSKACSLLLKVFLFTFVVKRSRGNDVSFTIEVVAGVRECFYQTISQGTEYEIEYQVVNGGELDINLSVESPNGNSIFVQSQKTGDTHKNQASESGDYIICFDNTFSHISSKIVFFRISIFNDAAEAGILQDVVGSSELTVYEITLDTFRNATDNIKTNLVESIQLQRVFSSIELRDRSIQEYNFERVNFMSGLQLFVMISVAMTNVLMIRGFFDDRHKKVTPSATKLRT